MHTVAQTHAFQRAARAADLSEQDIERIVLFLAANPMAGDEIAGTGGCRKVRFAGKGRGKSGGYRTITFYTGEHIPVFLLTVFSKGERSDLSAKERNGLKVITTAIVAEHQLQIAKLARMGR